MDSYILNMRKSRTWGGHIEIIGFAELFETNIFIYDLVTDLESRHKMEYSNSFNTVRLMYRNNDHYITKLILALSIYFAGFPVNSKNIYWLYNFS